MNPQQIQQMMKQAQRMQDQLHHEMQATQVEATAGGGLVTVKFSGDKRLLSIKIDPEGVSKDDVEMLQDSIMSAVNDALRKVDDTLKAKMGNMMPPGMGL
ncbi:MAG: YbaB/EbfC family nucleoid-associated protein [Vicinamibacterales bacterium]